MRLTRLIGSGFRNLEPFDFGTDAPFVVVHGPNAQGKTNLLEAVYVLSTLRALRGRRRTELIRWGEERATLTGWVRTPELERRYRVDLTAASRMVELDGKRVNDLSEYFAGIRCICFTPQDGRIVSAEPGWRRKWLDRAAFTARPSHLDLARSFRRALAQKAAALKESPQDALLDALDAQVARTGAELVQRRVEMLRELQPHVRDVHRTIADGAGSLGLTYRTMARGETVPERMESLLQAMAEARPRERRRQITLVGPQTDDVKIKLGDHSARTYGSRGQVRSVVLSLKLAELIAAHSRGELPVFLIDDVSGELDRIRTGHLVRILGDLKAQVWATTTVPEHLADLPSADTLRISVDRGSMAVETPI